MRMMKYSSKMAIDVCKTCGSDMLVRVFLEDGKTKDKCLDCKDFVETERIYWSPYKKDWLTEEYIDNRRRSKGFAF